MAKYVTKQFSGYCPKQCKNYTIDVSYSNIPLPHLSKNTFIRVNFCCKYYQNFNCEHQNICPIFKDVPTEL